MKRPILPQISQIYADETQKQQNSNNCNNLKQPVFLCGIMQPAAFLCVICAICGRITRKRTQSICTEETPIYLPLISQIYADKTTKPQNSINLTTSPTCLSLRNNAACCIRLRHLRDLRENIHARGLYLSAKKQTTKQQYSNKLSFSA